MSAIFHPTDYIHGWVTLNFSDIPTEFAPCVPDDVAVVSKRMSQLNLSADNSAGESFTVYLRRSGAKWTPSVVIDGTLDPNNDYMALDIAPCGEYDEVMA